MFKWRNRTLERVVNAVLATNEIVGDPRDLPAQIRGRIKIVTWAKLAVWRHSL